MRERELGRGRDDVMARGADTPPRRSRMMRRVDAGSDEYAAAFERVRLVRAWIAAAAAFVAVMSGCIAVIERVMK